MDVNSMSIEEIEKMQQELESRRQKLKTEELNMKRMIVGDKIDKLLTRRDFILSLINHSRSSCSDENTSNGYIDNVGYAKCIKCHLIEIFDGYYDDGEFDISFDATITKVQ